MALRRLFVWKPTKTEGFWQTWGFECALSDACLLVVDEASLLVGVTYYHRKTLIKAIGDPR